MDPLTIGLITAGIGGLGSTIGNLIGASKTGDIQQQIAQQQMQELRDAYNEVSPYYDSYRQLGEQGVNQLMDYDTYGGPLSDFVTNGRINQFDNTPYNNINNYLDPSMDFQQEQARRQAQASAMGQGSMLSGAAQKALQDRAVQLSQTDYNNAFNRMQTDKSFAYNQYLSNFANARALNQDKYNQLLNQASMGANATNALSNLRTGQATNMNNALSNYGQGMAASASAIPAAISGFGNTIQNMGQGYLTQNLVNQLTQPAVPQVVPQTVPQSTQQGYIPQGNLPPSQGYTPDPFGTHGYFA